MLNVSGVEFYNNRAEFMVENVKDGETEGVVRYAGGGGSGIGTDVGVFAITKQVEGDVQGLPADQLFTGTYTVTTPTGEVVKGEWSVAGGDTWRSPEFVRGSTVVVAEDTPTGPGHIAWSPGVVRVRVRPVRREGHVRHRHQHGHAADRRHRAHEGRRRVRRPARPR